jgi:hypothetical protein
MTDADDDQAAVEARNRDLLMLVAHLDADEAAALAPNLQPDIVDRLERIRAVQEAEMRRAVDAAVAYGKPDR